MTRACPRVNYKGDSRWRPRVSWSWPRCHWLADGPGAARMFVLKHFLDAPPALESLVYADL